MADDEQFSLCWNNFNSNLSAGFHESLCRGDLVDVTLTAEGQFVKAHRLVLSVCSPYFRKMFTQMPANQHAFVFLKDVSHSALKDLIQFMYCGEVNVKQEALPAFISTAEALQIKGLTDGEPAPSQSPAKPSTPAPQQVIPGPSMTAGSPRVKQRSSTTTRSYKIESEDSGDDKSTQLQQTSTQQTSQQNVVQQTQKRPAQRSITPHTAVTSVKRLKVNDPLETTEQAQITVQTVTDSKTSTDDPEFIDLPIDLPTKSEPDYTEEAGEVEAGDQEATYVEDDSYGDMKYDESYFTENDEGGASGTSATVKAATGTFSESYVSDTGEQSTTEAQVKRLRKENRGRPRLTKRRSKPRLSERFVDALKGKSQPIEYVSSIAGGMKIIYEGHHYKHIFKRGKFSVYQCSKYDPKECQSKLLVYEKRVYRFENEHNHIDFAFDGTTTERFPIVSSQQQQATTSKSSSIKMYEENDEIVKIEPNNDIEKYDDFKILNFKVAAGTFNEDLSNQMPMSTATAIKTYTISDNDDDSENTDDSSDNDVNNKQKNQNQNDKKIIIDNNKNDNDDLMTAEDFKAKIKKRLQKALLGGKN